MTVEFFGQTVKLELPSDEWIQHKVIEILNFLGYEWPETDPGVLDAWAERWEQAHHDLQHYVDDLEGGLRHLASTNSGAVPDAVVGYLTSEESNVHSLSTVVAAAPLAAGAYRGAAALIVALRLYVIGQILLDAVSLIAAILSGGTTAALSFMVKQGAKLAINVAIDQTVNDLMGA